MLIAYENKLLVHVLFRDLSKTAFTCSYRTVHDFCMSLTPAMFLNVAFNIVLVRKA